MLKFKTSAQTGYQSWRPFVDPSNTDAPVASLDAAVDAEHTELARPSPYSGWHPMSVAGRLRRAWKSLVADSPWPAMHVASHIFALGLVLYLAGVACLYDSHFSWPLRHRLGVAGVELLSKIWLWGGVCLIPVLAGARIGTKFPHRGALGTLFALAIMTMIGSPFFLGATAYTNANIDITKFLFSRENYVIADLVIATVFSAPILAGWMVIGSLTALLTGTLKRLHTSEKKYAVWFAGGCGATGSAAVDHFLDAVDYHLKTLTADTRLDIRNELKQHIESLTVAHEELGAERDEATASALRQFGAPRTIARRFCRAWAVTAKETVWSATSAALKLTTASMLSFFAVSTLLVSHLHLDPAAEASFMWGAVTILPMVIGARIGHRFPQRGAIATFYATSFVALAAAPVCYWGLRYGSPIMDWGVYNGTGPSGPTAAWYLWQATNHLIINAMIWPPIATMAAAVAATCCKVRHHLRMTNA